LEALPEGALPEGALPEGALPEGALPEGALPEGGEAGPRVSLKLAFYSVRIGYMVNYAAPRLGEVARSANVASRTRLRFSGVFGTVVVERVLDVLTLGVALLTVLALFGGRLLGVAEVFGANTRGALSGMPSVPWTLVLVGLVLAGVGLAWVVRLFYRKRLASGGDARDGKLLGTLRSFRDGLVSLVRVRQKGRVLLATVGIWFCYLLMADIPLRMLGLAGPFDLGLLD